jgi:hypothetical protein
MSIIRSTAGNRDSSSRVHSVGRSTSPRIRSDQVAAAVALLEASLAEASLAEASLAEASLAGVFVAEP